MTLDELNRIDVNSPEQVKSLQKFLKTRGYYSGAEDGKWGGGTIEGVKALRGDLQTESERSTRTAEATAQTEKAKNSWERVAQEAGPYAAGAAGGAVAGYGLMQSATRKDAALGDQVSRMAGDKKINPVIAEKTFDSRINARRVRTGAQFLAPGLAFGAAEFTRDYIKPRMDPESQRYVDMAANAEQGVGVGLAGMLAKDAIFRGNPVDADTEALLRSRAAEARGDAVASTRSAATSSLAQSDPGTDGRHSTPLPRKRDLARASAALGVPPASVEDYVKAQPAAVATTTRNSERLATAAKTAGATGKMTKANAAEHLLANLNDSNRGAIAKALGVSNGPNLHSRVMDAIKNLAAKPGASAILAGLVGAGVAGSDPAEAADGGERTTTDRIQDAAISGTAAGGMTYGATKLAPHIAQQLARSLVGRAALRALPPVAAGMTAYDVGSAITHGLGNDADARGADRALRQGNPSFFGQQEAVRQGAYGEAPTTGPYYDEAPAVGPQAQDMAWDEPSPEAVDAIKDQALGRISAEQMRQMVNALASQGVASRGNAFPQPEPDDRTRRLAEALMGGY